MDLGPKLNAKLRKSSAREAFVVKVINLVSKLTAHLRQRPWRKSGPWKLPFNTYGFQLEKLCERAKSAISLKSTLEFKAHHTITNQIKVRYSVWLAAQIQLFSSKSPTYEFTLNLSAKRQAPRKFDQLCHLVRWAMQTLVVTVFQKFLGRPRYKKQDKCRAVILGIIIMSISYGLTDLLLAELDYVVRLD